MNVMKLRRMVTGISRVIANHLNFAMKLIGDLRIARNRKLRRLLSKKPKY